MKRTAIILFISILLIACNSNKFDVDISDLDLTVKVNRFEHDLFSIPVDSMQTSVLTLHKKYGLFLDAYSNQVINIGGINESEFTSKLKEFMYYCRSNDILTEVNSVFPTFDSLNNELTQAFKYYKYYFPKKTIPEVYTYISAFNQSIFTDANMLGIGLDKYLGSKCKFYERLGWEKYLRNKMHKKMIPVDCMRAWCMMEFPMSDSINNMMSNMVYEGKIQYFLDATLPFTSDTLKWGYTSRQLSWAGNYENKVWAHFVEKKMLFMTELVEIKKYIGEAPFTVTFANVSAPRMGTWIGYKIVCGYMKNNPNVSLQQLMNENDYQKILNFSKYNP